MAKSFAPMLVSVPQIVSEVRQGVSFYYVESEGLSEARACEIASTLAKYAVHAMMRDPRARVVLVSDRHEGGIGISLGDGLPNPVYEIVRIPASWTESQTSQRIREEMRRVPFYRNPQ